MTLAGHVTKFTYIMDAKISILANSLVRQRFELSRPKPLRIEQPITFFSEISGGPCLNLPVLQYYSLGVIGTFCVKARV